MNLKGALNGPNDDTIYRRDQSKRIQLINWVLDNMKNPEIQICAVIESKKIEIIDEINKKTFYHRTGSFRHRIKNLDWILYQVCSNEIKKFERLPD